MSSNKLSKSFVALNICLIAMLTLLYLAPIVGAGLSAQDIGLGSLRGFAGYEGLSAMRAVWLAQEQLQLQHGGWFPLQGVRIALWLLFPDAVASKSLQLALIVSNVSTFALLVMYLTRSIGTGTLAATCTLLAIELRKPHDAILGDSFGLTLTLELVLLSLCSYAHFVSFRKPISLVLSCFLQLAACSMNEIAMLLTVLHPLLNVSRSRNLGLGWLIFLCPVIVLVATFSMHLPAPGSLRWLIDRPVRGFYQTGEQLLAVLPTSYRLFGNVIHDGAYNFDIDTRFILIPAIDTLGWIVTLLGASTVFVVLQKAERTMLPRNVVSTAFFAAVLIIVAAFVQSPTAWQNGLPLGEAFPSVYVGCFGFGAGFAVLLMRIRSSTTARYSRAVVPAATALFALIIFYGNARVNARVIALNRDSYETVNLIRRAGAAGLFQALPSEALVGFDRGEPLPGKTGSFENLKYLLYAASGRRFRVASSDGLRRAAGTGRVWIIRRERSGALRGGLTVAHVVPNGKRQLVIDRAFAFRHFPAASQRDEVVAGLVMHASGRTFVALSTSETDLYGEIVRTCAPVSLDLIYEPDVPRVDYGTGFFAPSIYKRWSFSETYYLVASGSTQGWRYAERNAALVVENSGCGAATLHLRAAVYGAAPGLLTVTAPGIRKTLKIAVGATPLDLIIAPKRSRRFIIHLETRGPAATEEVGMPILKREPRGPAYLVVVNPTLEAIVTTPRV